MYGNPESWENHGKICGKIEPTNGGKIFADHRTLSEGYSSKGIAKDQFALKWPLQIPANILAKSSKFAKRLMIGRYSQTFEDCQPKKSSSVAKVRSNTSKDGQEN